MDILEIFYQYKQDTQNDVCYQKERHYKTALIGLKEQNQIEPDSKHNKISPTHQIQFKM